MSMTSRGSCRPGRFAAARRLLVAAALVPAACSGPVHQPLPGGDPDHPRLRFLDGSVSLNDRCPITGGRLNPHMDPLFVNGKPVGFC